MLFDVRMSVGSAITHDPSPAPDPGAVAPDGGGALRERQLAILSELAEAGLEIALALKGRIVATAALEADPACPSASAAATGAACADLTRAFDRASRAVRMTIALQQRLSKEAAPGAPAKPATPQDARKDRADRVRRIVGRVIRAQHKHSFLHETLDTRTRERLYDPDITGELEGRPIGELVSRICDDLGLWPRWRELAEEAWAQDEIVQRPPGSPFAAWPELPPGALDFDELDREDPDPDDPDDDFDDDEDEPDGHLGTAPNSRPARRADE